MSSDDRVQRIEALRQEIMALILGSGLNFYDSMGVIGQIQSNFRRQGEHLLNAVNIQEVTNYPTV